MLSNLFIPRRAAEHPDVEVIPGTEVVNDVGNSTDAKSGSHALA